MIIDIAQASIEDLNVLRKILTLAEEQIRTLDLFTDEMVRVKHSSIVGWLCQVNNAIDVVTAREKVLNG